MVSYYMPFRYSMVPTGVSQLSKWQAIKAFDINVELGQRCVCFFFFSLFTLTNATKLMSLPQ